MSPRVFSFSRFKEKHARPGLWMDHDREIDDVRKIIRAVQEKGDRALFEYTSLFDGAVITGLALTADEENAAVGEVSSILKDSIREALKNIEDYHRRQIPASIWSEGDGIRIGQVYRPLKRVGAYVPGGTASYPSSVLMTVVPAHVAGVEEINVCTPPAPDGKISPAVIFAAREAGAGTIFKIGGAQAVAALAYGTESIPAVDKIVGPGNIYVTLAKREVAGDVGIDMLAGPSEIMIVADSTARADYIAADLLSQAEHGPLSRSYLVTDSAELIDRVGKELDRQLADLPRRDVASVSLEKQGGLVLVGNLGEAWEIVNLIAPEHLEILLPQPWKYIEEVRNAGTVFLGPYSPEPLGDYWAGVNHVLPTGGSARFSSPLGVDDFMRYTQVVSYEKGALGKVSTAIQELAGAEGFDAHARSIKIRGRSDEQDSQD